MIHAAPGCDDPACCESVCGIFPSCCTITWDDLCVQLADAGCVGYCGASASGSCVAPHQNPACEDAECCSLICGIDPFCCDQAWDTSCATAATLLCASTGGECGTPGSGSCFDPHPTGACSDEECCTAVCTIDASCCSQAWDFLCVLVAESVCTVNCTVECPPNGLLEDEVCGLFTNDPCLFPTAGAAAQPLACGQTVCGRIVNDGAGGLQLDIDAYSLTLSDSDGDGLVRLSIEFKAEFTGFLAVVSPQSCGDLSTAAASTQSVECLSGFLDACLPAGQWLLLVGPGSLAAPGATETSCGVNDIYFIEVACIDDCGPPCSPTAGECFEPHAGLGCNVVECCEAVCAELPPCCASGWDVSCAQAAVGLCGGSPPRNDECTACLEVGEGTWEFTTIGAAASGPPLPPICDEGSGLSLNGDIWFCYTPTCDATITVKTCDAAQFDTRIAIYERDCTDPLLIACNDDGPCLLTQTSLVEFQSQCGTTYLIRVGGFDQSAGLGTLTISCGFGAACPPPCSADLDGDGAVGGADLGILLAQWGGPGSADLDASGSVDGADLGLLLAEWGNC
jgi:hypothetical protein